MKGHQGFRNIQSVSNFQEQIWPSCSIWLRSLWGYHWFRNLDWSGAFINIFWPSSFHLNWIYAKRSRILKYAIGFQFPGTTWTLAFPFYLASIFVRISMISNVLLLCYLDHVKRWLCSWKTCALCRVGDIFDHLSNQTTRYSNLSVFRDKPWPGTRL